MIINTLQILFQLYSLMILITILGSWFPNLYQYRLMQMIVGLTAPYLQFFRRIIPPLGMIDLSPLVALIALEILQRIVISFLL